MKKMFFLSAAVTVFFASAAYSQVCEKGDCKNGAGTMTWKNGDKYEGQFKAGKMDGKGTLTYKNGTIYIGDYVGGKIVKGTISWTNGDKYEGAIANNTMNGKGTIIYKNGTIYSGDYVNGKIVKGAITWKTGDKYDGAIANNTMNGIGTMTWKTGDKYEGSYKDGKRDGIGTMIWKSGNKYVGQWKLDQIDGDGIMTYSNKKVVKGKWKNGQPVAQAQAGGGQTSAVPSGKYGIYCLLNPGDTIFAENPTAELIFNPGGKGTYKLLRAETEVTGILNWKLVNNELSYTFQEMPTDPEIYNYDAAKKYYTRKPAPYGPNQVIVSQCILKKIVFVER